jgi:hypothetical protein
VIKVLYVEGNPRFEYRFLKNALLRDPRILAQIWLASADKEFPREHTRSAAPLFSRPLAEFPRDLVSLLEYDVLIYGDVDPATLGEGAAARIESFVSEFGGGIVFITGGTQNPGTLMKSALSKLLPVDLDDAAPAGKGVAPGKYRLTPDGRTSTITQFREFRGDRDRNLEHWEDRDGKGDGLPGVTWHQAVRKVKPGTTVLVEAAGAPAPAPLFAQRYSGRGRVFWSATDETWRWRRETGDEPWFYPFWKQTLVWAREGKQGSPRRFRIVVDKDSYRRGDTVTVFANAYDENYDLRTDPELEVSVMDPKGSRIRLVLKKDPRRDGLYEGAYRPSGPGDYSVWVGEDRPFRATAPFWVRDD